MCIVMVCQGVAPLGLMCPLHIFASCISMFFSMVLGKVFHIIVLLCPVDLCTTVPRLCYDVRLMQGHPVQQSAAETSALKFCMSHHEQCMCRHFFPSDFASVLGVVVCMVYGLLAGSVASLPSGRFFPYLGWGLTSTHSLVLLPLHTIMMQLLKDNLGFC